MLRIFCPAFRCFLLFFSLFFIQVCCPLVVTAQSYDVLGKQAEKLFVSCAPKNSAFVAQEVGQQLPFVRYNESLPLKPASVIKLLTSAAVLEDFGPNYKFETNFYLLKTKKDVSLVVEGLGDPSIREKELWEIVHTLRRRGVSNVTRIVLDDTAFVNARKRSGQRAYEAGVSALTFNFNTVMFEVCPGKRGQNARVQSEPHELAIEKIGSIKTQGGYGTKLGVDEISQHKGELRYKLKGYVGSKRECEEYYRSIDKPIIYFGRMLGLYLQYLDMGKGMSVERSSLNNFYKPKLKKLYTHKSKPLSELVKALNHHSSNMLAEHMLMLLGSDGNGRFDRKVGIERMKDYVIERGFKREMFKIFDASGLDHHNRLQARMLVDLLVEVVEHPIYGVEFLASLPVSGRNGTLKKRFKDSPEGFVRAKTGTLTGVTSLSGYVRTKSAKKLAFAFMQQGVSSKSAGNRCEEKVLNYLARNM